MTEDTLNERIELVSKLGESAKRLHEAVKKIQPSVREDNWISVKDRMPEPNVLVMVFLKYGTGHDIALSFSTTRFPDIFDHFLTDRITHWQPLPEPPKQTN
jgi:hypothetical protein